MPPRKKAAGIEDILSEMRTSEKIQIGTLDSFDMNPVGLSTGNLVLNALTGIGGIPKGHVSELFGKPSSGKTTTGLQTMADLQRRYLLGEDLGGTGHYIAYWDFERTLDERYVRALGIDTHDPSFIYYQPKSFEDGANRFRRLMETGELGACVFDSVAKMVTEKEKESETGKSTVADRAKLMHQFMRQIIDPLYDTGTAAIFLNHQLDLVDATPMGQQLAARGIKRTTTPGGMALPFYSSLRVEFKQVGNLRDSVVSKISGQKEDQIRQTKVQATVVKNKVGDPFGTAELRVRFGKGFSNEYSVLNLLRSYGVVTRDKTGKHTFPENLCQQGALNNFMRGEDHIVRTLETDREWFGRLESYALDLLGNFGLEKVDGSAYDENGNAKEDVERLGSVDSAELGFGLDLETGEIDE